MELRPALEAALNADVSLGLGFDERNALIADVLDDMTGLGPLQALLEDDSVTEIMVNGLDRTYIERGGVLCPLGRIFESEEQIRITIDRIISPLGRRVDERSPMVNARLPNGFRVNAVIPPIAIDGPTMTIRKFSDRISTLAHLVDLGSIPDWYAHLLGYAVRCRMDLAVAGGTGSGKTTLLNALSCEISQAERIVTIEDSAELQLKYAQNLVSLETRNANMEGCKTISVRDLIRSSLRMRPDRIIVGEVRGAEICELLTAYNSGHAGSMSTGHGNTARDMLLRMETMLLMGMDIPLSAIRRQIASGIDILVHLGRMRDKTRKVLEIAEITGLSEGEITTRTLYAFEEDENSTREKVSGKLEKKGELCHVEKLEAAGFG